MEIDEVAQVLRDPVAVRLLESPLLARLAYNGVDGAPRVVPIGYVWTGSALVMCTATMAPKVRALQRDPRIAFEVDTEDQPPNILLVRGVASVEIVDGVPDEFLAASRKAVPEEAWSDFEAQSRAMYPSMARITVIPHWAKVIDFEERVPIAVEKLMAGKNSTA
jgi:pyridoxamine 5'-phosphate oxidase-like protein